MFLNNGERVRARRRTEAHEIEFAARKSLKLRRGCAAAHCGKPPAYRELVPILFAATPPFEAQPRIIFASPTGKAEPFRYVRRDAAHPRGIIGKSRARLAHVPLMIQHSAPLRGD